MRSATPLSSCRDISCMCLALRQLSRAKSSFPHTLTTHSGFFFTHVWMQLSGRLDSSPTHTMCSSFGITLCPKKTPSQQEGEKFVKNQGVGIENTIPHKSYQIFVCLQILVFPDPFPALTIATRNACRQSC